MRRVVLTRRAKIWHDAGETVLVSSAEADFLCSVGSAVPCRETPEAAMQITAPELPEEAAAPKETPAAKKKTGARKK